MQQAIQHQASTACHPDFPDKLIIVGPEQGGLILNQTVSATQPDNPAVSLSPYILMLLCVVCFAPSSPPAEGFSVPLPVKYSKGKTLNNALELCSLPVAISEIMPGNSQLKAYSAY